MAFRDGYINLARTLYALETGEQTLEEAKLRSAISRAYYGVFNLAKELIQSQGYTVPKRDAHKFVIDWLQGSTNIEWTLLGIKLNYLRDQRCKADYGDHVGNWEKNARLNLKMAIEVKNGLQGPPQMSQRGCS